MIIKIQRWGRKRKYRATDFPSFIGWGKSVLFEIKQSKNKNVINLFKVMEATEEN